MVLVLLFLFVRLVWFWLVVKCFVLCWVLKLVAIMVLVCLCYIFWIRVFAVMFVLFRVFDELPIVLIVVMFVCL